MRCIRTEMYFDGNYIRRSIDKPLKLGDVSFAWIKFEGSERRRFDQLPDLENARSIRPDQVNLIIDYILRRERIQPFIDSNERILNESMIAQVFNGHVVIEQSPPEVVTLSHILKEGVKGSTVALSLYVAINSDLYLFLKLPAALLIIGASKGISKWLEQNLPKLMTKATSRWLR